MTREQALVILGLDASATSSEVLEAYSDLSIVWQPERFENDERLKLRAQQQIRQISDAYALLMRSPEALGSASAIPGSQEDENYDNAFERKVTQAARSRRLNQEDGYSAIESRHKSGMGLRDFIPLFPFLLAFFVISISAGVYVGTLLFDGVLRQKASNDSKIVYGMNYKDYRPAVPVSDDLPVAPTEVQEVSPVVESGDYDVPLPPELPELMKEADSELLRELLGEEPKEEDEEVDLHYKDRDRLYTLAGKQGVEESFINYTPNIVNAAILCKPGRVKKLIEKGEDLGSVDSQGNTALIWAVRQRCHSVVDVLLKAGADPNVHSTNGFSAYVWARLYQSERIMKLLKDAGANTSEGSYWWRNDREARLAWIEQSLKRLCKNGRCQRWAQEEKLRRQRGESRD